MSHVLPAVRLYSFSLLELSEQVRRQDVGRKIGRAEIHPGVLVHLAAEEARAVRALLAYDLGAVLERFIVHDQRPAFAAAEVLRLMKGLGRQRAEGPQVPALVATEQPVGVVFDDGQTVRCSRSP